MDAAAASLSKSRSVGGGRLGLRIRQTGYALGAAVASVVAGTIVSLIIDGGQSADDVNRSTAASEGAFLLPSALIVAPLIETLILSWILLHLLNQRINRHVAVLFSATLWTAAHSFQGPAGLSVFFPFVIYSYLFVERRNPPYSDGFLLAALAHFFYNLIVLCSAYCGGLI